MSEGTANTEVCETETAPRPASMLEETANTEICGTETAPARPVPPKTPKYYSHKCGVPSCNYRRFYHPGHPPHEKRTMFSCSRDKEKLRRWSAVIPGLTASRGVCVAHFEPRYLRHHINKNTGRLQSRLSFDAVPTLLLGDLSSNPKHLRSIGSSLDQPLVNNGPVQELDPLNNEIENHQASNTIMENVDFNSPYQITGRNSIHHGDQFISGGSEIHQNQLMDCSVEQYQNQYPKVVREHGRSHNEHINTNGFQSQTMVNNTYYQNKLISHEESCPNSVDYASVNSLQNPNSTRARYQNDLMSHQHQYPNNIDSISMNECQSPAIEENAGYQNDPLGHQDYYHNNVNYANLNKNQGKITDNNACQQNDPLSQEPYQSNVNHISMVSYQSQTVENHTTYQNDPIGYDEQFQNHVNFVNVNGCQRQISRSDASHQNNPSVQEQDKNNVDYMNMDIHLSQTTENNASHQDEPMIHENTHGQHNHFLDDNLNILPNQSTSSAINQSTYQSVDDASENSQNQSFPLQENSLSNAVGTSSRDVIQDSSSDQEHLENIKQEVVCSQNEDKMNIKISHPQETMEAKNEFQEDIPIRISVYERLKTEIDLFSRVLPAFWTLSELPRGDDTVFIFSKECFDREGESLVTLFEKTIALDAKNHLIFSVHGKALNVSPPIVLKNLEMLLKIILKFNDLQVCRGISASEFEVDKGCVVYKDDLNYSRHVSCTLITDMLQCKYCYSYSQYLVSLLPKNPPESEKTIASH